MAEAGVAAAALGRARGTPAGGGGRALVSGRGLSRRPIQQRLQCTCTNTLKWKVLVEPLSPVAAAPHRACYCAVRGTLVETLAGVPGGGVDRLTPRGANVGREGRGPHTGSEALPVKQPEVGHYGGQAKATGEVNRAS